MNTDDFKKLLDESLRPIKTDLEELKRSHYDLKDTVEKKVLPSVTYIETNIKAYKDAYQNNNANARKLEKRVEVLEDDAGIVPPSELILAEVR